MSWTTPRTWIPGETPGATEMNQHVRDNLNAILPVGALIYRVALATTIETVVENRFLECNGVAVSRTTYASLFSYFNSLSLPFGTGDGSTTFNLPDLRGRMAVGMTSSGGHTDVDTLGDNEGVVLAYRRPRHGTSLFTSTAVANQITGVRGSLGAGESTKVARPGDGRDDQANTAPVDTPAYLVAGVWFVKYTA